MRWLFEGKAPSVSGIGQHRRGDLLEKTPPYRGFCDLWKGHGCPRNMDHRRLSCPQWSHASFTTGTDASRTTHARFAGTPVRRRACSSERHRRASILLAAVESVAAWQAVADRALLSAR